MPILFLLLGAGVGFAMGYQVGKDAEDESQPVTPPALPPPPIQTPRVPGGYPYPGTLGIPPVQWPIIGGTYIQNVGWCPPGMVYDLATKLCVPEISTQGFETGACCDSCAMGGPCEGCE